MPRRVAIAGVSTHWGMQLARALERDPSIEYIAGVDGRPPSAELGRTDFIEADLRSAVLGRLLPGTDADTLVHCGVLWYPEPGRPARALHDINVMGTLQLLAACERMPSLRRIVVRGSAAIYGCEGAAPLFFTEDLARQLPLRTRFQRDISELEGYFETFARRHPEIACCTLRFQPELGPDLAVPLARYLRLPIVPTQLGFDPRLQLVHEADATGALEAAVRSDVRGAVNVAPDGAISLSRILRMTRSVAAPVPHVAFGPALERLGKRLGAGPLTDDAVRLLRFGRAVSCRRLREELRYQPRFDAVETVAEFARTVAARRVTPSLHPASLLDRLAAAR